MGSQEMLPWILKNNKIILISPTNKKLQFKNIHWYQNQEYYLWVILAILSSIFFDAIVKRNINTHQFQNWD